MPIKNRFLWFQIAKQGPLLNYYNYCLHGKVTTKNWKFTFRLDSYYQTMEINTKTWQKFLLNFIDLML